MKNVPEIIFGWCFTFDAVYSSNVGFMYKRYYPSKHVYIGPLTVFSGHRGIPAPRRPARGRNRKLATRKTFDMLEVDLYPCLDY